ncbi:MAG: SPFH/Band 7/PHB domain protein [Candidatus Cloacimonetes bacterium]|nr:SPFH/Band 7/PHB domain protein [Candidatus Cloacimonadota bacterium]MDD4155189.1 SPFH/Band 7/PHB domain protein [Candidatus Cloacimonadota bacterium]
MELLIVIIALIVFVLILVSNGIVIVKQAEVLIIERFGRYHKTLESGLHIILPIIDKYRSFTWRFVKEDFKGNRYIQQSTISRLDLRETVYDFPRQNVITADNVSIEINAMVYFQVTDPFKAVYEINNLPEAIEKLTQTTLRNVIGELDLDKTLTSRDMINSKLREILDEATDKWGVKVNRVELQDINPPREIKNAMEKQMRAERDKRAKILEAEGTKQSDILEAEGFRNAQITRAEGEARSRLIVAEAEAEAIRKVATALKDTKVDPAEYQIALKYITAFSDLIQKGDKTIVLPYEATSLLGSVKTIESIFKN